MLFIIWKVLFWILFIVKVFICMVLISVVFWKILREILGRFRKDLIFMVLINKIIEFVVLIVRLNDVRVMFEGEDGIVLERFLLKLEGMFVLKFWIIFIFIFFLKFKLCILYNMKVSVFGLDEFFNYNGIV